MFLGRGIVRTMMITPFLIVPVAAALVFKHAIYNPIFGLLNGVITWVWGIFGSDNAPQVDWITQFPLGSIEVTLIWQWTPFMTLILLAGLQSRPGEVLEAAAVDGASHWQMFTHMTLPHMRQYLELAGLLGSHLRHPDLRRRLHHHLRRPGHREPAVHHLPDPVHRTGLRARLRARGGRGHRVHRDRHLRGEERLQPALRGHQMTITAPSTPTSATRPAPAKPQSKNRLGKAALTVLTWAIGLLFITPVL